MIKFFRHIRQNLIMENKTGKYFKYAIGEIVLVMLGILLALQVNNWRDQHAVRKAEQKTISLLIRDLKGDYKDLQYFKTIMKKNERNTFRLMRELENGTQPDSLVKYARSSISIWNYRPSYPTYKGLIENNKLDIISNDSIRDAIIQYFDGVVTYLDDLRDFYKTNYNQASESLVPYVGHELSDNDKWTYTSITAYEELKNNYEVKHRIARFGRSNSNLATRIDSLFAIENKSLEDKLENYLNQIK